MNRLTAALVILFGLEIGLFIAIAICPSQHHGDPATITTYSEPYTCAAGTEPELESLQCPIPMECRVRNYTGIQCVYSSTEMLGRWAEEPKLVNPPLTSRGDCKGYSSSGQLARVLRGLDVKFEQSTGSETAGILLIKKAMEEGRGCLFGVPGHAMVLVHYDEETDRVCWVDNSDRSLQVQTMTIRRFKERWSYWVCVIYADNEVIPYKIGRGPNLLPIVDWTNPHRQHDPKDLIVMPKWRS